MNRSPRALLALTLALAAIALALPAAAQNDAGGVDGPPFALPLLDPPGPATWLFEQGYGNTTAAYNYGDVWYIFGQGLHFGLDFEAPCGTPVHAIADGVVTFVDAEGFGVLPHSLVMEHPGTGYTSLYGHLSQAPAFARGDRITRGQQIGVSGDPDGNCLSRPHLHLEIRQDNYHVNTNPIPLIDANWHMLASLGGNDYQQDLDTPYRWLKLEDQPDVRMVNDPLNNYRHPWPLKLEQRAQLNTAPARRFDPLPEGVAVTREPVALEQWNLGAWWDPRDLAAVYLIDAVPGQGSGVYRQPLDGSPREYVRPAPPAMPSPDGSVSVEPLGQGVVRVARHTDGSSWEVYTGGYLPAVSPDGSRLLWEEVVGEDVPGTSTPAVRLWISNLDGAQQRMVFQQSGGWSQWLDAHRLIIFKRPPFTAETQVYLLNIDDGLMTPELLGTYRFLTRVRVSPGGAYFAYLLPFQEDPSASGIYVQRTEIGSTPRKLDFFGAYEWRDDRSLYTLSFDGSQATHALGYLDVESGAPHRWLTDAATTPIRVANGEWSVSPDGAHILFVDPLDYGLYMLTVGE